MINFIRKLFKIEIPDALTCKEWEEFFSDMKQNNFIGYFLTEMVPDCYYVITKPIRNLFSKIRCRIKRYYLVDTKLDRYQYHDITEKMLWANFSMLNDYVDIELVHMYKWSYGDKPSTIHKGLKYCLEFIENWEMKDDFGSEEWRKKYEIETKQFYKEVYDLYWWWNFIRPIRIDPFDLYYVDGSEENTKKSFDIERQYNEEDQEMLIRLINIRERLWT